MKVAVFSTKSYDRESLTQTNAGRHELVFHDVPLNVKTAALVEDCNAVCCFVNDQLNAAVLKRLSLQGVTLVVLRCAEVQQVDLAAANALGITVARVPGYSPHAVAEHALGLILMLNRHLHRAHYRVRENDYSLNGLLGFDLAGKTVGVIGTGSIGSVFARIMQAIGCKVIANDPIVDESLQAAGVTYVQLDELYQQADIISLHCPVNKNTRHIINAAAVAAMKTGVMVINTGAGALVNTEDAIEGLKSRKIGYLGLDVYEAPNHGFYEDNSNQVLQDDVFARLLTFPNVVVTGHQAFFTRESLATIGEQTLDNITAFESGKLAQVHRVTA